MPSGSDDPELVDILVTAVEDLSSREGRPLDGTRLGHVLGDAYRQRHLLTGSGAYRRVVDAAVRAGRVKRVWDPERKGRMALVPTAGPIPPGWSDEGGTRSSDEGLHATPSSSLLYLREELYEAFSGLRPSVSLDFGHPPTIRVVEPDASHPAVTPLEPTAVVEAWSAFAAANDVSDDVKAAVVTMLGSTPETVWRKIYVPGDDPSLRLGSRFHRTRLKLLADYARKWLADHGKEPEAFDLARPRPTLRAEPVRIPRASIPSPVFDNVTALRDRLKRIIDRMSKEQLYELRIPAEFLDV